MSKKATLHVRRSFFVHFFDVVTTGNFQKLPSEEILYMFLLYIFFSLPLIFTLVVAGISHFLTTATKFSCCSSNKKCLLCFLSLALLALCRSFLVELPCPIPYFLFFSVFLYMYSKFVDMTINLSL